MGFTSIAYREKKRPVNVSAEYCSPTGCGCSSSQKYQSTSRLSVSWPADNLLTAHAMHTRACAPTCVMDTSSVGRFRSRKEAPEMSHLLMGAQKCTVKGPAAAPAKALTHTTVRIFCTGHRGGDCASRRERGGGRALCKRT